MGGGGISWEKLWACWFRDACEKTKWRCAGCQICGPKAPKMVWARSIYLGIVGVQLVGLKQQEKIRLPRQECSGKWQEAPGLNSDTPTFFFLLTFFFFFGHNFRLPEKKQEHYKYFSHTLHLDFPEVNIYHIFNSFLCTCIYFPELLVFESKLQTYCCSFIFKYFNVYFLRTRTVFFTIRVQQSKSGN